MELINGTRMQAGYTMGLDPAGHQYLVVVIKGTFRIPPNGGRTELAPEQVPLVLADTFAGDPGASAPVYEADFALRKSYCDVVLNGTAYAPGGRPARRVAVGLRIGNWQKAFAVCGDRVWQAGSVGPRPSPPEPFVAKPISYDCAFGGFDVHDEDPARHAWYMENPVGRGFHGSPTAAWVDGAPMPNTEELDRPVALPDQAYKPMAFGSIGRNWLPRSGYAGTYDQEWLDRQFPFLPSDFNDLYYQAAPEDQRLAHPVAGQVVTLVNLIPGGTRSFTLPPFDASVTVFPKGGEKEDTAATLDTLLFEPDLERMSVTWRVSRQVRRSLREVDQVFVGRRAESWWRSRDGSNFPVPVVTVPVRRESTPGN